MTKRASIISLSILLMALAFLVLKPQLELLKIGYNAYLESATDTYVAYGDYLVRVDSKLDLVLAGDYDQAKSQFLQEEKVVDDFFRDSFQTSRLINGYGMSNFQRIYSDLNLVMTEILADSKITESERHYIETLKAYTAEITTLHQKILGDVKTDGYVDYNKTKALAKHIPKRFQEFTEAADRLLSEENYAFMTDYQGDFSNVAFEPVRALVNKLFEKMETGKLLIADNRSDTNNNTYQFDTDKKSGDIMKDISGPSDQVSYSVYYDKRTKMIEIVAVHYTTGSAEKLWSETEALAKADALAKRIHVSSRLLSKKTLHGIDSKALEGYEFTYQVDNQGTTQAQQQLIIEIGKTGIITQVKLCGEGL